ncbi:TPA: glycosyl hydrolase family 28-related protein, partial [Providencia alcalifaciens]
MREVKPTQKPVPSSDIKDLFFNSGLLDIWATSLECKYIDRFGNCHLTAAGMEWLFKELVTKFKIESEQALLAAGYAPAGTFQEGADVVSRNGTVLWKLPDGDGDYYRWDGDLPKQVPAGSTPQSTGGIDKGAWVSVGDASLRGDLNRESGAGLSGFSHDVQYAPATVGHKLKNSVWVTDSPFNAKMDGVTDDTIAFQKAIDSGKIVQIPTGDTVVSNLTIYPNTTIIGCGRRHGIHVESGTQILYKGSVGNDWLTLADRVGMSRDGQG